MKRCKFQYDSMEVSLYAGQAKLTKGRVQIFATAREGDDGDDDDDDDDNDDDDDDDDDYDAGCTMYDI